MPHIKRLGVTERWYIKNPSEQMANPPKLKVNDKQF